MRYLKIGLRGPDVKSWAYFLRGIRPCSSLSVEEIFTSSTKIETQLFQKAVGLYPDGVVGPMTMGEAMKVGFNPLVTDDDSDTGPNWPPRPNFGPISLNDKINAFGEFKFVNAPTKSNPEGIRIVDDWIKNNIMLIEIPQLKNVIGAPKNCKIYLHKLIANQFKSVFQSWEDAKLDHLIISYGGSWVPRFIRGSRSILSNHAWGTAIDINVPWNYLGSEPALKGKRGSVRELISIANDHGLFWGGHYQNVGKDGMHLEIAKIS